MNRSKRQKAASVWFDLTKYILTAVIISGLFVYPINWRIILMGTIVGCIVYILGLVIEPKDKDEE